MKHIDLFSGIGGFAYAAKQVWGEEYENVCMCDINPFCQALLKLRFPEAKSTEILPSLLPTLLSTPEKKDL